MDLIFFNTQINVMSNKMAYSNCYAPRLILDMYKMSISYIIYIKYCIWISYIL